MVVSPVHLDMRRPLDPNRLYRPTDHGTVRGSVAFVGLLAGVLLVASYPLLTASVVLGGLAAATVYRCRRALGRKLGVVTHGQDRTNDGACAVDS